MAATEPLGPMIRVRDLRLARGLTLQQLADRMAEQGVSITESGLSNIEKGHKRASDRVLLAMARALGVEPLNVWHGPTRAEIARRAKASAA